MSAPTPASGRSSSRCVALDTTPVSRYIQVLPNQLYPQIPHSQCSRDPMCGWDRDSSVCRSYQPSLVHDPTGVKDNLCQVAIKETNDVDKDALHMLKTNTSNSRRKNILTIPCVSSGFDIQAEADRELRSKHPPLLFSGEECFHTGEISRFSLSALEMDQIMASNKLRN